MFEKLVTRLVDKGSIRIALEIAGAGDLAWEVVACVEVFEEASHGIEIFVNEVDAALLFALARSPLSALLHPCQLPIASRDQTKEEATHRNLVTKLRTRIRKPRTCGQQCLMRCQKRLLVALPNQQTNDRTF